MPIEFGVVQMGTTGKVGDREERERGERSDPAVVSFLVCCACYPNKGFDLSFPGGEVEELFGLILA